MSQPPSPEGQGGPNQGGPQYSQPTPYGQPPQYGPPYGQPQGPPPQYGPPYGQPQGPPPQYGQGSQYGQGQPYPGSPYGQPPQYGQQGYGQPGYGGGGQYYGEPRPRGNGLAIATLVVGIFALLLCWTIVGGIGLGLIAFVLGLVALGRSRSDGVSGRGMAIGGIALGVLGIVASIVLIVIGVGLFNSVGGADYLDCITDAGNDQSAVEQCDREFQQNIEDRFDVTIPAEPSLAPR